MKRIDSTKRWRRLSRTSDEGDDLFQDAVMHAFEKLSSLRDEERFASWFFAVREIAAMQRCTESAVKSRLSRGRGQLRRYYERLGFGEQRETGKSTDKEKSDDDARIQLPCA